MKVIYKKRLLSLVAVGFLPFIFPFKVHSQSSAQMINDSRTVSIASMSGYPGGKTSINIVVSDDLFGFASDLLWISFPAEVGHTLSDEPEVPTTPGSDQIAFYPDNLLPGIAEQMFISPGILKIGMISTRPSRKGGRLIVMPFVINPGTIPGKYTFQMTGTLTDLNSNPLTGYTIQGGELTVVSPGDVNGDNNINIQDAIQLLRIYLGLEEPSFNEINSADTRPAPTSIDEGYGDGMIQSDDLNWLIRYLSGLQSKL